MRATVRTLTERPVYYENALQRSGTSSPLNKDRRPVLIRGSPRQGLQDMLVPSIETASSDAYGVNGHISYSRPVIEPRRQSPDLRKIIVIPDDSPQHKRRRMIQNDDFRRSPLLHASSAPSRDFLPHYSRVPASQGQGLFRNESVPDHLLPVYDAPQDSGYSMQNTGHVRRTGDGLDSGRDLPPMVRHNVASRGRGDDDMGVGLVRRPANDARTIESERERERDINTHQRSQQLPLPNFPAQKRISHSYDMGPDPVVAGQTFIDNFSQSRVRPVLPQNSFENQPYHFHENGAHVYENSATRSYIPVGNDQGRSRGRYTEEHS